MPLKLKFDPKKSLDLREEFQNAHGELKGARKILSLLKRVNKAGALSAKIPMLRGILKWLAIQQTQLLQEESTVEKMDAQSAWAGRVQVHYELLKSLLDVDGILSANSDEKDANATESAEPADARDPVIAACIIKLLQSEAKDTETPIPEVEKALRETIPLHEAFYLALLQIAIHCKHKWLLKLMLAEIAFHAPALNIDPALTAQAQKIIGGRSKGDDGMEM